MHELKLHTHSKSEGQSVKLEFRGYEIKTVRLTIAPEKKKRPDSGSSWVKV